MSDLDWTEAGPRSRRFDDVYFSAQDGLAESRSVFLAGCGLPERWRGRRRFVVGELGFGAGLNILALLELWRRERTADSRLHIFSVEAFPLDRDAARRALDRWPELADLAEPLLQHWPRGVGLHRMDWPDLGVTLDVAHGDAAEALGRWSGRADAWFLDGFAPARNPQMWSPQLMRLVAERSAPGAMAATFTVAGTVRRSLTDAGFAVEKRPGFGRKRERLEARLPGETNELDQPRRVLVVGGGIAGLSLCRAFGAIGTEVALLSLDDPAASGNPAALVSPRIDAGATPGARLALQAWRRATALYEQTPDAVIARGLIQLEAQPRDAARFDKLAAGALFAPGEAERVSAEAVADHLLETCASAGLSLAGALTISPASVLAAWAPPRRMKANAVSMSRDGDHWRVTDSEGAMHDAEIVVLAAGWGLHDMEPDLGLRSVRGQVTWVEGVPLPAAAAWGGYAVPTRDGLLFGATHDRDRVDGEVDPADDRRNLEILAGRLPSLAARIVDRPLQARAAIRATTPDRLPLAGRIGDGLYVLGGLGSRGFTFAPLLAEHVAAEALGAPSPLPADFAVLVKPGRFAAG